MPSKISPKKKSKPARSRHTGRPLPERRTLAQVSKSAPKGTIEVRDVIREMIKLGSIVTDIGTELPGMATHFQVEMNGSRFYRFQPRGINPEDGSPVKGTWIVPTRLNGGEMIPEPYLPLHILGTEVEDDATGFIGMATALCLHISGCIHVTVQPKGKLEKTGAAVDPHDFDIRRLKGPALQQMTEAEIAKDKEEKPSPGEITRYTPSTPEH